VTSAKRPRLILASASPRRAALLRRIGWDFSVHPVAIDESSRPGEEAERGSMRLAREKALHCRRNHPQDYVLGADTVVSIDRAWLGKPRDRDEAREMLHRLSGRTHHVFSGVALVAADGTVHEGVSATEVTFASLSEEEIERYLDSSEPYDKAGAYAIQGAASWFIEGVRGSVTNVVGLPLEVLRRLARESGLGAAR